MSAYYNENDPYCVAWLRNLIAYGLIADGEVDARDIQDVTANDLAGFTQCHFFAGIGGWSVALRLAGWPDDRGVWTGSCPCQPFSTAGKGRGFADERHLWPAWFWLLEQRRPGVVFGEQVASPAGRRWIDLVSTDVEACAYAFAAGVLPAASVRAPHERHRLWWVADASDERRGGERLRVWERGSHQGHAEAGRGREAGGVGHADNPRLSKRERVGRVQRETLDSPAREAAERRGNTSFWADADWIPCRDGKHRPVEPGTFPLAHGIPGRVGRLRAYGNAISPQVAAEFIGAYLDVTAA